MSKEKQNEIKVAADLIQDEHNYRKHSDTNKARIKKSIDEAGLGRSVVIDADGVLVAGNGVQQVIDGDTPVRVIETDGTELVVVKRTDLHTGDPRRKTLALADNATSDDVEWDFEAIEADGWDADSAGEWGVDWPKDEEETEAKEDDFDQDAKVETVCKRGDIWQLGNHRLMCGDSTDANDVTLLTDGEKADMVFLDPPFDMDFEISDIFQFMKNDSTLFLLTSDKFLIKQSYKNFDKFKRLFCVDFRVPNMPSSTQEATRIDVIAKFSNGKNRFRNLHDAFSTLIECFKKHSTKIKQNYGHKQAKAVALPATFITHYTNNNDVVLDLFGGAGSTLIAAEQLNRKCYMMELDEHYCDVIIARWEKFTGNKAEKLK